jgi:hypothetical protein
LHHALATGVKAKKPQHPPTIVRRDGTCTANEFGIIGAPVDKTDSAVHRDPHMPASRQGAAQDNGIQRIVVGAAAIDDRSIVERAGQRRNKLHPATAVAFD